MHKWSEYWIDDEDANSAAKMAFDFFSKRLAREFYLSVSSNDIEFYLSRDAGLRSFSNISRNEIHIGLNQVRFAFDIIRQAVFYPHNFPIDAMLRRYAAGLCITAGRPEAGRQLLERGSGFKTGYSSRNQKTVKSKVLGDPVSTQELGYHKLHGKIQAKYKSFHREVEEFILYFFVGHELAHFIRNKNQLENLTEEACDDIAARFWLDAERSRFKRLSVDWGGDELPLYGTCYVRGMVPLFVYSIYAILSICSFFSGALSLDGSTAVQGRAKRFFSSLARPDYLQFDRSHLRPYSQSWWVEVFSEQQMKDSVNESHPITSHISVYLVENAFLRIIESLERDIECVVHETTGDVEFLSRKECGERLRVFDEVFRTNLSESGFREWYGVFVDEYHPNIGVTKNILTDFYGDGSFCYYSQRN